MIAIEKQIRINQILIKNFTGSWLRKIQPPPSLPDIVKKMEMGSTHRRPHQECRVSAAS
jgi:hypothetical protein